MISAFKKLGRWYGIGCLIMAAALILAVLLPKCEGPGPHPFTRIASVTTVHPPSQVVDGLYKSLVVVTPGNVTLICILTRLPQSFPHFTIPPEYSCVRAPVQHR